MAAHHPQLEKFEQLRHAATQLLAQRTEVAPQKPTDILNLIQELRIYETELEIQNEELRRAQHALADLKQEYEALYELAPCGYITLNPNGLIDRINLTGVTLLGAEKKMARQTSLTQFVDEAYHDAFIAARKKAALTEEKQRLEMPLTRASGKPLWVNADIEAEWGPTGSVRQWRIILTDISKRRAVEKQRMELEEQLQQAKKMQALGTLAGGIAHEFNNILTVIIGNIELTMEMLPKAHPTVACMQETLAAGLRAGDVVKQLLAFTRKNIQSQKPIELGPAIKEALKIIRSSTPANIDISDEIEDDLLMVMADATQIHQIIINLCANAVDAMLAENGILKIRLQNSDRTHPAARRHPNLPSGRYVKLTVSDTGQGMDDDTRSQIFEPFYTTKAVGKGTGMGLAVVHGIVENHGGAIFVESAPGSGTTFELYFPESVARPAQISGGAVRRQHYGNERILLIDDEAAVTKISRMQLERLGYGVEAFTQPLEALKRFESAAQKFDLVITDMAMPKMTGEQLAGKLRRIRQDIPIILCTGYSERINVIQTEALGIHSCLMKPYRLDTLSAAVRSALPGTKTQA